jgi:small conductance mechanosensitive channel
MNSWVLAQAENRDLAARARDLWDRIAEFVAARGIDLGMDLVAAIAILAVGRWASRLVHRILLRVMDRVNVERTLSRFVANICSTLVIAFVILAAINRLGVDTTSLAAMVAAAGLAVGFALQGSLANFAAGVMLIVFRPFKVGDLVETAGSTGVVEELHIFNTMIRTGDNVQIIIPNSQITGGRIANYSTKGTRQLELEVRCRYEDDLRGVKKFLQELLAGDARILRHPAPLVAVGQLGDSGVTLLVRPWVHIDDYSAVRCDLLEKVKLGFDERGFRIPYPQQDVHVHNAAK